MKYNVVPLLNKYPYVEFYYASNYTYPNCPKTFTHLLVRSYYQTLKWHLIHSNS